MIERFNRTLEDMISKYLVADQRSWDESLPLLLLAYRSSTHESTGFSPALLFFWREPRLPLDLLLGSPPHVDGPQAHSYCQYVDDLQSKLQSIHEVASQRLVEASNRQKRDYDHRENRTDYNTGDLVLVRDVTKRKGLTPKLQSHWKGPYTIVKLISDLVYLVRESPRGKTFTVHHDRLKPFYVQSTDDQTLNDEGEEETLAPDGAQEESSDSDEGVPVRTT